jgi:protein-tyrosine phosphatase
VIDLHCHVLPGLDDGPRTMDESLALLEAQAAAGVRAVVATTHVDRRYPGVTPQVIAAGVRDVSAAAARAGIDVAVIPGAEVALTRATNMDDAQLRALRLGDGPWLLLEPPHAVAAPSTVEHAVGALLERGQRVVLAHPERSPAFLREPAVVRRLVARGALCSVTAGAVSGSFGRTIRRFALELLDAGLVHDLASDAHGGMASRPPGLREHLAGTGHEALADWLCDEVPRAIVTGGDLPARPRVAPRPRGLARRLLRRAR